MHAAMIMPRCLPDNVRAVHKQAWSLQQQSIDVTLVTRETDVAEYLGMRVVEARAPFDNVCRAFLNLPPLLWQCLRLEADIYLLRNPDTLLLGIFLKILRRRVIYDSHEDFTKRPMMHPLLPRLLRRPAVIGIVALERLLARISDGNIVTQRHQVSQFGTRKTIFIDNAPLITGPVVEASRSIDDIGRSPSFCLLYVGGISADRGLFRMLDLVVQMNTVTPTVFRLVGRFKSEELLSAATRHGGWQFTEYYGEVHHARALAHMRFADVGLAILEPVADFPTSSITKLYEYMWTELPFVASNFDAWRKTVEPIVAGVFVNPTNPNELFAAVADLAQDREKRRMMGANGKNLIHSRINWESRAREYCDLVSAALPESRLVGRILE